MNGTLIDTTSWTSAWIAGTSPCIMGSPFALLPCTPDGTDGRLLVLSELNNVLIWRDYTGRSNLTGGEMLTMQSGKKIKMFIRPGALALVQTLLRESRCDFAIVSGMEEKYCVPIARKLLQRAYSHVDWTLEKDGEATCWMLMSYPYTRVYIIGQAMNRQGAECVIKDFNRVWTILGQRGCGWYTEQNTVLLDITLHTASHPDSVHWMRPWKPQELGAE